MHLAREMFLDMPALLVDTGLEFPELVRAAKSTPNVEAVWPETSFKKVLETRGWPAIFKIVSEEVHFIRASPRVEASHPKAAWFKKSRWAFLLRASFKISQYCCDALKKGPLKREGCAHIVGTRADESWRRRLVCLQIGGCDLYDGRKKRSAPLSVWSEQDVSRCVQTRVLRLPYGDLGKILSVTGRERAGCVFCLFGIHPEGLPNRLELMAKTHPRLHDLMINRLGAVEVLRWLRNNAPEHLRTRFRA